MQLADKERYLQEVEDAQRERQLIAPDDRTPAVLLPYQQRWQEDHAQVRLYEKSRRIGISWSMASEAVLESAESGGMDQFYIGYNVKMAAEFIGDCAQFARAFEFAASTIDVSLQHAVIDDERRDIVTYTVRFPNGKKIEALSSNPHNFRSRQGHARIDEAAFHPDLDELIKAAMAFLMWGGRVSIVSTHNGEENRFNTLIRETLSGKWPYSHHKVTLDDALRDGLYKRICLIKGIQWSPEGEQQFRDNIYTNYGDAAAEELDCIPRSGSGSYIPRIVVEKCQDHAVPVLRYNKPDEFVLDAKRLDITQQWINEQLKPIVDNFDTTRRHVAGQDFGRNGDLSDIVVNEELTSSQWRNAVVVELRNIPFDCQQLIMAFILSELPHFHHCKFDARGNGQSHAEHFMQKYGPTRIECVMATAQWYAVAFPKYKSALEDRSLTLCGGEDILTDHRRIVMEKGRPRMDDGRDKGSDGQQRHGDLAIAELMAWMAAIEEGVPPAGVTVESDNREQYLPTRLRQRASMRFA